MAFESIHNYYEQMVLDQLVDLSRSQLQGESEELLCDIACVALNQLPARYVRHNVDMVFYMTPAERQKMEKEVIKAVKMAIDYVNKHRDDHREKSL